MKAGVDDPASSNKEEVVDGPKSWNLGQGGCPTIQRGGANNMQEG